MRQSRGKLTGMVHVLVQGHRCMGIFKEKEDQVRMEAIVKEVLGSVKVPLYLCLIKANHMHLILDVSSSGELSGLMKRISLRYGTWYRKRHGWEGQVFRDRYRSEPVLDQDQLLMTVRYLTKEWEKDKAGLLLVGKNVRDMFYFSGGYEESLKKVPMPARVLEEIPDYYGMTQGEADKIIRSRLGQDPRFAFLKLDDEEKKRVISILCKEDHVPSRYIAGCLEIQLRSIQNILRKKNLGKRD